MAMNRNIEELEDNVKYIVTEGDGTSMKIPANHLAILIDLDVSLGQTESSIGKRKPQEAVAKAFWSKIEGMKLNLFLVRPMEVEEAEPEDKRTKASKARKAKATAELMAEDSNKDALIAMLLGQLEQTK